MDCNHETPLRIKVSDIKKGPVRRCGNGIAEEDELRRFFHGAGCKVAGVRLVMESKRVDRSRGFGFVDLEDLASLDLALKLHGKEAEGLAGKHGKLRIERAHAATDDGRKRERDLLQERNTTEEMERNFTLDEARLHKLVREVKRRCEWQNVAWPPGLRLQEERWRQAVLRRVMESIRDASQRINNAIKEVQEDHDVAVKAIVTRVHGEQTQEKKDKSSVCEDSSATSVFLQQDKLGPLASTSEAPQHHGGATSRIRAIAELSHKASSAAYPDAAESAGDDRGCVAIEFRVRNTFIEFGVPEALSLRRTRTTPI